MLKLFLLRICVAPPGGKLEKTFERVRPKAELINAG
jgi:hypothetical protein